MKRKVLAGLALWAAYTVGHWFGYGLGEIDGKRQALLDQLQKRTPSEQHLDNRREIGRAAVARMRTGSSTPPS